MLCGRVAVEAVLDLVGDMGDHLDSPASEVSPAFLLKNRPVDLPGGDVGILTQTFIDKTFIMSQIQIRLRAVVGHEDLAVLYRVHGAGVDVDVRVELLHGYRVSPGF